MCSLTLSQTFVQNFWPNLRTFYVNPTSPLFQNIRPKFFDSISRVLYAPHLGERVGCDSRSPSAELAHFYWWNLSLWECNNSKYESIFLIGSFSNGKYRSLFRLVSSSFWKTVFSSYFKHHLHWKHQHTSINTVFLCDRAMNPKHITPFPYWEYRELLWLVSSSSWDTHSLHQLYLDPCLFVSTSVTLGTRW